MERCVVLSGNAAAKMAILSKKNWRRRHRGLVSPGPGSGMTQGGPVECHTCHDKTPVPLEGILALPHNYGLNDLSVEDINMLRCAWPPAPHPSNVPRCPSRIFFMGGHTQGVGGLGSFGSPRGGGVGSGGDWRYSPSQRQRHQRGPKWHFQGNCLGRPGSGPKTCYGQAPIKHQHKAPLPPWGQRSLCPTTISGLVGVPLPPMFSQELEEQEQLVEVAELSNPEYIALSKPFPFEGENPGVYRK